MVSWFYLPVPFRDGDTDGSFYSQFSLNSEGIANSIKYYMRISQRKFYHREISDINYTNSYFDVMDSIKAFLKVSKLTDVKNIRLNAGIYDSAHLIFHGPSVHRKIGVRSRT